MTDDERALYLSGMNVMRMAVWHTLVPILKENGYTDSNLSLIFKECHLLYPVDESEVDEIEEHATSDYYLRELKKNEKPNT